MDIEYLNRYTNAMRIFTELMIIVHEQNGAIRQKNTKNCAEFRPNPPLDKMDTSF